MSLFNWFSGKSASSKKATTTNTQPQTSSSPGQAQDTSLPPVNKPTVESATQLVNRKVERHARREQLYAAIRECMTRAGVLSASYKFKVLSLDQRGDQFLVMMDVAPGLGGQANKLAEIEILLVSTAKNLFSIDVTSVYWRTDNRPAAANAVNFGVSRPAVPQSQPMPFDTVKPAAKNSGAQRCDPIHADEMAAFKQALLAASAHHPATPDVISKSRSGLRSFTLITGFEDTEMPESLAAPALSRTQHGELH